MQIPNDAVLLRIFLGESDRWEHKPLYEAIVLAARAADPAPLVEMIQPAQDTKFGDFQANFAMPLGKQLGQPPRKIAEQLVAEVQLDDLCEKPEIAVRYSCV